MTKTIELYTKNDLLLLNKSYNYSHILNDKDVDKVNNFVEMLSNLDKNLMHIGDIVVCKATRKNYKDELAIYNNGHIEQVPGRHKDVFSNICTEPYTPFITESENSYFTNTSGGYWLTENDITKFRKIGERYKLFCTWGHCGMCGNGAVDFKVLMSVWEYCSENIY